MRGAASSATFRSQALHRRHFQASVRDRTVEERLLGERSSEPERAVALRHCSHYWPRLSATHHSEVVFKSSVEGERQGELGAVVLPRLKLSPTSATLHHVSNNSLTHAANSVRVLHESQTCSPPPGPASSGWRDAMPGILPAPCRQPAWARARTDNKQTTPHLPRSLRTCRKRMRSA